MIKNLLLGIGIAIAPGIIGFLLPVKKCFRYGISIGVLISNALVANLCKWENTIELRLGAFCKGILIGLRKNNEIKKDKRITNNRIELAKENAERAGLSKRTLKDAIVLIKNDNKAEVDKIKLDLKNINLP